MSLIKFSQYIIHKQHLLRLLPRYSSNSIGDKGEGDSIDYSCTGYTYKDDSPSARTTYDCRKYGHNLPRDNVAPYFETLPYIPTEIFRCTYGEMLGRGANKRGFYRNPEYFSYQHMTFYDMHLILRPFRQQPPKTGRKP